MPGRNRLRHEVKRLEERFGELVEAHEGRGRLSDFTEYRDDPVGFIRDVLNGQPWEAQERIAGKVRDCPRVVVQAGNGLGKDWCAARIALWWVYARQGLCVVSGPTQRQVNDIVMGEVRSAFAAAEDLPGELFETALRVNRADRVGIRAFTARDVSSFTGHHSSSVLVILTEAQGVESDTWEGAFATLTGEDSRFLALGNPLEPSGRFYQITQSDQWERLQISADEHPNVVQGEEVIEGAITRRFIQDTADTFGRGSPVFAARVLGEFPDQGEESLFRRSWLERAAQTWEAEKRTPDPDREEFEPVVSVDPARYGTDATAVAVRRGMVLEEIRTWSRVDLMETVGRVQEVLHEVGVERFIDAPGVEQGRGEVIVDSVGVGSGVVDRLDEEQYAASGFKASRKARDAERFMNARAEAYWELRERLEDGRVALPRDEELFDELLAIRWRASSGGKVRLESKADLRDRIGRSPDRADAVVMAFYSNSRRRVPSAAEVGIITWGTK